MYKQPIPIWCISNSEVRQVKSCLRNWNLQSNNRRNLQPTQPDTKLWLGTGVHYALEHMYGSKRDPVEVFQEWGKKEAVRIRAELGARLTEAFQSDMNEVFELGQGMLEHYKVFSAKNDDFDWVASEYEFEVPIPDTRIEIADEDNETGVVVFRDWVKALYGKEPTKNEAFVKRYIETGFLWTEHRDLQDELNRVKRWCVPALFVGKMDGICKEKKVPTNLWLFETKTRAQDFNDEILILDEQTAKYQFAAQWLIDNNKIPGIAPGTRLRGVLYNVLRKKVPRKPEPLKSRPGLSKNKSIDTTYEVYLAAIKEHGYDSRDYADILRHLKAKPNKFFHREKIRRGTEEMHLVGERMRYEFETLQRLEEESMDVMNPRLFPSPSEDCLWKCRFKTVCIVANYGGDAEGLIEHEYEQQKSRGKVYAHPDQRF